MRFFLIFHFIGFIGYFFPLFAVFLPIRFFCDISWLFDNLVISAGESCLSQELFKRCCFDFFLLLFGGKVNGSSCFDLPISWEVYSLFILNWWRRCICFFGEVRISVVVYLLFWCNGDCLVCDFLLDRYAVGLISV